MNGFFRRSEFQVMKGLLAFSGVVTKGEKGFALVVVVIVMLMTSFLASMLIFSVRTEQRITFNSKERITASFLAEAGVNSALFMIVDRPLVLDPAGTTDILLEGLDNYMALEKGKVNYSMVSESGKIDLNTASPRLLELFFEYQGLVPEQIATIKDSLLDWRDNDDLYRLHGAEQDHYLNLPNPYIPRNGKVEDPAEFFLINGSETLSGKFRPEEVFTVYNPQKTINVNSLTPTMLDFVMAGDDEQKKAFREAQKEYLSLDKSTTRILLGEERFALLEPFLSYKPRTTDYYSIISKGRVTAATDDTSGLELENSQVTIRALVRLLNDGYQVLSWQEWVS